ncbi:MAG: T9SS type A sorting domain-containing protein, partial [Melioribacteraceae bacterium]|nr:T9SS type A sorting domain-containing protein [Melioribacteraceae bacterium]
FQNYPNPFNGDTNIKFQISQISNVKLEIYNILGQKIKTLVDQSKSAGYYSVVWNGKNESGHFTNAGIYLMRFSDGNYDECRKLIFLK